MLLGGELFTIGKLRQEAEAPCSDKDSALMMFRDPEAANDAVQASERLRLELWGRPQSAINV